MRERSLSMWLWTAPTIPWSRRCGLPRYRVGVHTEGGHSYGKFGNLNAIQVLSSMIDTLYSYKVPAPGKSTYNVGTITGGTSINTIAQYAEMRFEYRSDVRESLGGHEQILPVRCGRIQKHG